MPRKISYEKSKVLQKIGLVYRHCLSWLENDMECPIYYLEGPVEDRNYVEAYYSNREKGPSKRFWKVESYPNTNPSPLVSKSQPILLNRKEEDDSIWYDFLIEV